MICVDEIKSEDVEYEIVEYLNGSTSYQGEITTDYYKLKELFGKPSYDTGIQMKKSRLVGISR